VDVIASLRNDSISVDVNRPPLPPTPATLGPVKMKILALVVLCVALVAACGEDDGGADPSAPGGSSASEFQQSFEGAKAYPVFISSELVVGENRFLVGLLDENDAPIGDPSIDVAITFYDLVAGEPKETEHTELDFIPMDRSRGVYVTHPTFDRAGTWGAAVSIQGSGIDEELKGNFEVRESGTTPAIGAPAPASDTPTSADVDDLSEISTDPKPDPRFYEKSVTEALDDGDPFVLAFATPKFCQTAACGPALDVVQGVAKDYPKVTFIHVEPYKNLDEIGNVVPSVQEWGLPSEPYIFVVDSKGNVAAKFEGIVGDKELRTALDSL
jgi:hypothetical protein